jgi:hypothetical protein
VTSHPDQADQATTDGGTDDVRDYDTVRHSGDLVKDYSADGRIYAYRDGEEHVAVSRGREPPTRWVKRVPAERTAVVPGEHLWTIPDNWEPRVIIDGAGASRYKIFRIPETGVDVLVTVPHNNHLVDAWYGVKRVGTLEVTYDDEIAWDELADLIEQREESGRVGDDVIGALETLHRRRRSFAQSFAEGVDMCAERVLFENGGEPVRISEWTVDPWTDTFPYDGVLEDVLDLDDETRDAARRELSEASLIPLYPEVRVDVADGEGLPEGFLIRALTEAGASAAETVDYLITEHLDAMSQTEWAEVRDCDQSAVSRNVSGAEQALSE